MNDLLHDIRYALRQLRRSPGFTAVAALTLALGIGSNVAMFTVVNAVLLRPLPYPDPGRIVMLFSESASGPFANMPLSMFDPDFEQLREQNQSFEAAAMFNGNRPTLSGRGEPALLSGAQVTQDFFDVFGMAPAFGRAFLPADYEQGPARVVVLGEELWRSRVAADPAIVGQTLTLDGEPFTVVGVMPGAFRFPESAQLWTPAQLTNQRNNTFRQVIARLKADVPPAQAQAEIDTFMANLTRQHSDKRIGGARVAPVIDHIVGRVRSAMWLFLGAVGFVLLIACANVAHLALARSERRQREITVRAALGAGRWRLARQLLVESCVLSLGGGALAFLFAIWGSELLVSILPADKVPRLAEIAVDWRVFGFALLMSLLAALLFGSAPAWRATRANLAPFLKESLRTTASAGSRRFRGALIVAEMALAVVLLTGAGLLLRSFTRLLNVDPGFRPDHVLSLSVSLPEPVYRSPQQMNAFYQDALERLASQPGVVSAGLVNWRPLGGSLLRGTVTAEDPSGAEIKGWASKPLISPGYLEALGVPLVAGRLFTAADREDSPPVAVISESLAKHFWGGQDPIGRRFNASLPGVAPWVTVVGVVGDIHQTSLAEEPPPAVYLPYLQAPRTFFLQFMSFVVRTRTEPTAMADALRRQVSEVDPNLPVYQIATMDQIVWASVAEPRFQTLLLSAFSALALVLAAIGIYGVMSYTVASSVQEIGVRLALGARAGDVAALFLRRGLWLTAAGLVLGVAGALALTRLLSSMLFQVTPTDPVSIALALAVLVVAALLASYAPARRAAAVDPAVALRHE